MPLVVTYEWNGIQDSMEFDEDDSPYFMDVMLPAALQDQYGLRELPRVKLLSVYDPLADEVIEFGVDSPDGGQWVGGN